MLRYNYDDSFNHKSGQMSRLRKVVAAILLLLILKYSILLIFKKSVLSLMHKPVCPKLINNGPLKINRINTTVPRLDELDRLFHYLNDGHWQPEDCVQSQRLAILIPLSKQRWNHLLILLKYLHPQLINQHCHYHIFVIQQLDPLPFNRGQLLNIGVLEARRRASDVNCFVLHDVDTVPISSLTVYRCHDDSKLALQMASYQSKRNYKLAYEGYAGGVLTVWLDQYEAINGFSNEFWGWGGEDDDLTNRLKSGRGGVARDMSRTRASFYSLSHPLVVANPNRTKIIEKHKKSGRLHREGLNTTVYSVINEVRTRIFTLLSVSFTSTG